MGKAQIRGYIENGALVARILRGAWRKAPPALDFSEAELERVLPLLGQTSSTGLAWWRVRKAPLAGTEIGAELKRGYLAQAIHSARAEYRVRKYVSALDAEKIDSIVFKGWVVQLHYAEPALRAPGDVDLAVAPENLKRARAILSALGASPVDVDVHGGLDDSNHSAFIPGSNWEELVERAKFVLTGGVRMRVLAPEEELTLLCIHFVKHLGIRPMWLCDVAAAVEGRSKEFDWGRCLSHPPYTSWIESALRLARDLLDANLAAVPVNDSDATPAWVKDGVLAHWGERGHSDRAIYDSIFKIWNQPARWEDAWRARVPSPFIAAVEFLGGFDEPLLARYQLYYLLRTIARFAKRHI